MLPKQAGRIQSSRLRKGRVFLSFGEHSQTGQSDTSEIMETTLSSSRQRNIPNTQEFWIVLILGLMPNLWVLVKTYWYVGCLVPNSARQAFLLFNQHHLCVCEYVQASGCRSYSCHVLKNCFLSCSCVMLWEHLRVMISLFVKHNQGVFNLLLPLSDISVL